MSDERKSLKHPDRTIVADANFRLAIVLFCVSAVYRNADREDSDVAQTNQNELEEVLGTLTPHQMDAYRMICSDLSHAGF